MTDIQSNIRVNIDTSGALDSIKALQRQISVFQKQMQASSAANAATAQDLQRSLIGDINATGKFVARLQQIKSTTESFTASLEKNKLSMGEYFRYSLSASKTFGKNFTTELNTIEKVARERVKTLQTQYVSLGRDASGALNAISVRPLALDLNDLSTKQAIAAQKQQIFNQLLKQGSTNLLNFGKNTQWAGRQLMVGFTIPLSVFGTTAAKAFMDLEEQTIKFKRVYGDLMTPSAETDAMIEQVKTLAEEYTKYGVAVADTMQLASQAAAMGKQGADLTAQVAEATRLAVLGNVSQEQALETSISLTNAFGIATTQLAGKIDFLNAVENQTVTSIEDLTEAIPKAGPVIQQLGGEVEDLAFFLTAMKEGGINASEGANALKSGLASLINPTQKAADMLNIYGVNIRDIVSKNAGNVTGIVVDFAKALDQLNPTDRARAIEQLFGKFQFARLSTLFQNVIQDGSQAAKVMDLMQASTAELAALSNKELKAVEESTTYKFKAAIEEFKAALAPIGEEFMKLVTPLIKFGTSVLDVFNNMGDTAKGFITGTIAVLGGLAPVALMTFGLVANGAANLIKSFQFLRNIFMGVGNQSNVLGEQLQYMTEEQLRSEAIAASLEQTHARLPQIFTSEASAVDQLTAAYERANAASERFSGRAIPTSLGGGQKSKVVRAATGGFIVGPGTGTSDSIAAMVSNGEAIIPADMAKKYAPLIQGIIAGNIPGFATGTVNVGGKEYETRGRSEAPVAALIQRLLGLGNKLEDVMAVLDSVKESGKKLSAANVTAAATAAELVTKNEEKLQRGHIQGEIQRNPDGSRILGSLTRDILESQNQKLKTGQPVEEFRDQWFSVVNGLVSTVRRGGVEITDGVTKVINQIDAEIGEEAIRLANLGDGLVNDTILAQAASNIRDKNRGVGGDRGRIVGAMDQQAQARVWAPATAETLGRPWTEDIRDQIRSAGASWREGTEEIVAIVDGQSVTVARTTSAIVKRLTEAKTELERLEILTGRGSEFRPPDRVPLDPRTYRTGEQSGFKGSLDAAVADNMNNYSDAASPAKKTKKATENLVDGVIVAIEEGAPEVQRAMDEAVTPTRKSRRAATDGNVTVGSASQTWTRDRKSGNVVPTEKAAQLELNRQQGLDRYVGKTMVSFAGLTNKVIGLSGAISSATFLASAFGLELGTVGQTIFEVSNLLMILGTTTRALIASEKARQVVSAATDAANLISAGGGRAGFFKNLAKGDAVGRFAGAKNVAGNLGNIASKALEPLGKFGVGLKLVGSTIFRFIPLIGGLFTAFQIGKAIFDKTKDDIQGLGDTAFLSADKMAKAGELLGFTAKAVDFKGSFTGSSATTSDQQTKINELRGNDDFKGQFSTQINAIKGATKEQAELALKSLSIQMAASGAPKEAVDTLVKAITEEAGRRDLNLSFTSLDFSTKEGLAEISNVAQEAATLFQNSFTQNYNPGAWFGIQNAEMSKASETMSAEFSALFSGLKAGWEAGTLSAEDFNQQLAMISGQLERLDPAALGMILPGIMENLDIKDQLGGIENVYDQILLIKAATAGIEMPTEDLKAFEEAAKDDATTEELTKANKLRLKYNGLIRDTKDQQAAANAEAALMTQQNEDINAATLSLDEQISTLQNQINAHQTLRDMGYSEAQAQKIASNAMWATAIAAAQAQDAIAGTNENMDALLKKMEIVTNLEGKVSKFSGGGGGGGEKSDYEKAMDRLKEQRAEAYNTSVAYNRLSKAGFSAATAFDAAKDPILAAAIATTKVGSAAWKKLVALIKEANKAAATRELKDLLTQLKIDNSLTKSFTTIVPLLSKMGITSEQISDILSNPLIAQKFIDDLKDGKINSKEIYDYLNALKSGVDIQINFDKASPEGLREQFDKLYDNAMKAFDVEERNLDAAYAGKIKTATKAVDDAQKAVDATQDKIDALQVTADKKQREIELTIDRPIEALNESISAIEREIEMQYNRPIADLQEESSDLSNDLTLIDKKTEDINKKYDAQQKSLEATAAANKEVLDQDKDRLNIASAMASGNAAEAARAMQEASAREAEAARARQAEALQAARENEIGKLRSASGMSREQIEARQFAIGQQIFALEEKKEVKSKAILGLQDQIYAIEEKRKPLVDSLRIIEDQIYNLQVGELATNQQKLKDADAALKKIEDEKQAELDLIDARKQKWVEAELAADNAEVKANDYLGKLTAAKDMVEAIKKAWNNFDTIEIPDVTGKLSSGNITSPGPTNNNNGGGNGGTPTNNLAAKEGFRRVYNSKTKKWEYQAVAKSGYLPPGMSWAWDKAKESWTMKANSSAAAVNAPGASASNPLTTNVMPGMSVPSGTKTLTAKLGQYVKMPKGFYMHGMTANGNSVALRWGPEKNNINGKPVQISGNVVRVERGFDGNLPPLTKFNTGGMVGSKFNMGSDIVPSLLTPGEFVVNRSAVRSFGVDNLRAINSGASAGESVYNYSVNVSVQTGADADQIAKQVMTQIKRIDSQRIRGNRFNG